MEKRIITISCLLTICLAALTYFNLSNLQFSVKDSVASNETQAPHDWLYRQRAFPAGSIDSKAYFNAVSDKKRKRFDDLSNNNKRNAEWKFCGPANLSGRVTDIEMTKTIPQII